MKCTLVVIGASLGGLHALRTVLAGLPRDFDAAVAVAQHRDPRSGDALWAALREVCPLAVRQVEDKAPLEPGVVHLAPAGCHLRVEEGNFTLWAADPHVGIRSSIDALFETAARSLGPCVVGVVLTGTGSDGAAGLAAICAAGGTAIVQSEGTALAYEMPEAAARAVPQAQVLALEKIAPKLGALCSGRKERTMELPKVEIAALSGDAPSLALEVPEGERARVLVVDDNAGKLAAVMAILDGLGLDVVGVDSGRKALRALLERDFALIVLDVMMPGLDGYETAQLIHSRPRSAQTPIIFVTAEAFEDEARLKGYGLGAVDWIRSPISPEVLRAKAKVFAELYYLTRIARRQAEELERRGREMASQNLRLEEAWRVKSDFLAGMSHELRTPLNAIVGFSELLKDGLLGPLSTQQREAVVDIVGAGRHLLALINDILDLSKVEAGRMTLELEAVDVRAVLESCLSLLREAAGKRRVAVSLEVPEGLPWVGADATKLRQILFNLLSNAVKFTPAGGSVRVVVRRVARDEVRIEPGDGAGARLLPLAQSEAGEFLELAVSDTGIGIADDDLRRLFQTFVQIDSSLSRSSHGTGLGLALVRRLVELHHGTVGVASAPGKGSCFVAWIPWRDAPAESGAAPAAAAAASTAAELPAAADAAGTAAPGPAAAAAAAAESPAAAAASAPRPGALLALVIEDDEQAAKLLTLQLENEGLRAVRVSSAEEGIAAALREQPALITIDIMLPGMGGWEAIERLRKEPRLAATPVVIASIGADAQRGFALGAALVLRKPLRRAALHAMLQSLGFARERSTSQFTVLAVDDDPKTLDLVAATLEGSGARVVRARSGREALASARRVLPDLILLDLVMQGMDGFQVVEALRERPGTVRVPIVIVTGKTIAQADRRRLSGSVEAIVEKSSFGRDAFLAEVRRALLLKGSSG